MNESIGDNLPTSRSLLNRTWALLVANAAMLFAAVAWPDVGQFMPSQAGIAVGFTYGILCAAYHVHTIRRARRRVADLEGPDRETVRKKIERPWLIIALVQLGFGVAAFTEGIAGLYTAEFGHRDEATYIVDDTRWHPSHGQCYKHKFEDVSFLQNFFGGPCLDVEYPAGACFHYRGHSSWFGFKEDGVEIKSPPCR